MVTREPYRTPRDRTGGRASAVRGTLRHRRWVMLSSASAVARRAVVTAVLLLALGSPGRLTAQVTVGEWQLAGLADERVVGLQTPESGAFFATTRSEEGTTTTSQVMRSDD